jgi:diguanylate cyclase (GGDEF)-like protein
VIRRVARVVGGSYRRGGDVVGYWGSGAFVVLIQGEAAERATEYARVVAQRVRDLLIHHPRGGAERYLTVSAGVASLVPPRELALEALINACTTSLQRSKKQGKNSIATAEAADFQ